MVLCAQDKVWDAPYNSAPSLERNGFRNHELAKDGWSLERVRENLMGGR
jgi:hypothetical protein